MGGHADCLVHLERHADAEPIYRRGIAMLEREERVNLRELGAMVANLASVYSRLERHPAALPQYERAIDLISKAYGPKHILVGRLLTEQAHTHARLGQTARAVTRYQRALTLREEILSGDDPELAETLDGLAVVLIEGQELDRADALLRRSLAVHESNRGRDSVGHGRTWSAFGHLYQRRGQNRQAEDAYRRALDLLEPKLGGNDPLVLETRRGYDLVVRARQLEPDDISRR
jgi:tetratricopeptide (TPR) repeat protein